MTKHEVKRVYNVHSYELTDLYGHPYSYFKRRLFPLGNYNEFRPFCKCGWKSKTWHKNKINAKEEHYEHAVKAHDDNPRFEGM